jgi:three-Cys-motif partner protein
VERTKKERRWGGEHTFIKAQLISDYVSTYGTALKEKGFETAYVDAFAGSGWNEIKSGAREEGVAIRVLKARYPLHRYVFGDLDPSALAALKVDVERLRAARAEEGLATPTPLYVLGDANQLVQSECDWVAADPNRRMVMFLDPFGMQVSRASIEKIASTRRIDLWVLYPIGQALIRLMAKGGDIPSGRVQALDDHLGPDWRSKFYAQPGLFGPQPGRDATIQEVAEFVQATFASTCGPGTHPRGLPLIRKGGLAFWLGFACTNPAPQAIALALKFANELIRRAQTPK